MKYEIAQEIGGGSQWSTSGAELHCRVSGRGRQLSVNRKSVPRLAMKYAIGEVLFLRVRFGMTLRLRAFKPYTAAESPSEVSHEACNR
jgi:hypothetical protein